MSLCLKKLSEPELRRLLAREDPKLSRWVEVPAPIEKFIASPDYLNLDAQVWPAVREDLVRLFEGDYDEAVFLESIGAGKSFKSSIIIAYMVYRVECLRDPQRALGLAPGAKIAFLNMATKQEQAKDVVFGEIKARIDNSSWFKRYSAPDAGIQSRLKFPHEVYIIPGNSSENFPLGYNILGAVMDEAAFYHQPGVSSSRQSKDQAEEIYNALSRRIQSRFGHIRDPLLRGLLCMISSPRYEDDFIEKKYQEARTNKRILAVRRTLWEAKPRGTYSDETFLDEDLNLRVPVDFQEAWRRNPHKARRDIAARPSKALNPYMDSTRLEELMATSTLPVPVLEYDDQGYPSRFIPSFKGLPGEQYAVHVDLGLSRDACGIAIGRWDRARGRAVIEYADRIETDKKKMLDFSKVRDIILNLRGLGFKFYKVSYDNFQSVDSRQILESKGLDVELLSVDRSLDPYDTFLAFVNQRELDIYRIEHLLRECRSLELVDGKKVDHPPNGSKDIADAVAGVCYWIAEMRGTNPVPRQVTISNKGGGRSMVFGLIGRGFDRSRY